MRSAVFRWPPMVYGCHSVCVPLVCVCVFVCVQCFAATVVGQVPDGSRVATTQRARVVHKLLSPDTVIGCCEPAIICCMRNRCSRTPEHHHSPHANRCSHTYMHTTTRTPLHGYRGLRSLPRRADGARACFRRDAAAADRGLGLRRSGRIIEGAVGGRWRNSAFRRSASTREDSASSGDAVGVWGAPSWADFLGVVAAALLGRVAHSHTPTHM